MTTDQKEKDNSIEKWTNDWNRHIRTKGKFKWPINVRQGAQAY